MTMKKNLMMVSIVGALLTTTACTTDPYTGEKKISKAAIGTLGGAVGGYFLGDLIGGKSDRTAKILGAGIGAVAGAAVGDYMDRQERELRRQTAGTGVDVIRDGDNLLLRMPAGITFPVNSYAIQPGATSTLDQVAQTLSQYESTYIDVLGHASSDGDAGYNQRLSEQRAQSVADYLAMRGVARARMGVKGYGETMPIASNDTEVGRAQNRRVEIKVIPVTQ